MPREATAATTLVVAGTEIPKLGFGTGQLTGDACAEGVRDALALGYRHIDTARAYGNEPQVGWGLEHSGVDRGSIFLTTKLWYTGLHAPQVREQLEGSLRDLGVEHVDLLLIHWPDEDVPLAETLAAMSECQEAGRASHLGVANFPPRLVREALELAPIVCNQVEYHPFLGQDRLLNLARERDVLITAYSPLAHGKVPDDPTLTEIGEAHGKSAGQVALRWLLEQDGVSPIPKASSHERRLENFEVFDFSLTDDERERIAALPKDVRTGDPDFAPDWDA
jgi:2,5-diketo-D-gluconate reductase B